MIRITNIKTTIDNRGKFLDVILSKYKLRKEDVVDFKLVKESFDARRNQQNFVYTVDLIIENEKEFLKRKYKNVSKTENSNYVFPYKPSSNNRPIVVGSGPCGLFATYFLSLSGFKPILLERGGPVDKRVKRIHKFWKTGLLDKNTNVQFGEGGAGTFSDGKLTTNIKNERVNTILETFVKHGAPNNILHSYQPHIGTDNLRKLVINMRNEILSSGGEVRFYNHVTNLMIKDNAIEGVIVNGNEKVFSKNVLLAIGHSARDTYEMLYSKGVRMEPKPFSIGLRVEHLQSLIDESQYGDLKGHPNLDVATYKLKYHSKTGRSAYSFCMCPGGLVVASSSGCNEIVTNGMSYYSRAGKNANSAILVGVGPEDYESKHPLAGIYFQKKYEEAAYELGGSNYSAPIQLVGDFLEDRVSKKIKSVRPTYQPGTKFAMLKDALPDYVTETLKEALVYWDRRISGFSSSESILTGVETRSSAPLRILRDKDMQTTISGLFVGGEGAGYAGGIMSAAVDGIRLAEHIAQN